MSYLVAQGSVQNIELFFEAYPVSDGTVQYTELFFVAYIMAQVFA